MALRHFVFKKCINMFEHSFLSFLTRDPFGMAYAETTGEQEQPFKYNGKELDREMQLNIYDYAARYMDPSIGRFTSIDPHAEKYYSWSPYAYVVNNPLKYIDPDGRQVGVPVTNTGYWQGVIADNKTRKHIQDNASAIQKNIAVEVVSVTDVNDGVVLGTMITRGSDAINVDGTRATTVDKVGADLGAIIPVVSGSAIVKGIKKIGKVLGIGEDAAKAGRKLSQEQLKSISSLEKQIETHTKKLDEYTKDPMKFDNKDILKNAPSEEVKERIIQGRKNHLEHEIKVFKDNIEKIKNGE